MDLATIRLEVRERVGELSADFFSDAEVDRAIDDGYRRFTNAELWPWLVSERGGDGTEILTADDNHFDFPDDVNVNRVMNFSVDGGSLAFPRELERVDPGSGVWLRHRYSQSSGVPIWYYVAGALTTDGIYAATARIVPAPEIDYDVEYQYFRKVMTMTQADEVPDVPSEYVDAIPSWAAAKLFLKEVQFASKAGEQLSIYGQVLDQARADKNKLVQDRTVAWGREIPTERFRRKDLNQAPWNRIPLVLGP